MFILRTGKEEFYHEPHESYRRYAVPSVRTRTWEFKFFISNLSEFSWTTINFEVKVRVVREVRGKK